MNIRIVGLLAMGALLAGFATAAETEAATGGSSPAGADAFALASPFADGMVLQRDRKVPVWGTALAGTKVTVAFAGQTKTAVANEKGDWRVDLDPMPASSEGRTMTVNQTRVRDILVGEVWFCAGQSNMECPIVGDNPRFRDRQGAFVLQWLRRPNLRICNASGRKWSATELKRSAFPVRWRALEPGSLRESDAFSAVGFYFGLELHDALGVPVGLVGTYWGGTGIDPWTPRCGTASRPDLGDILDRPRFATEGAWRAVNPPTGLFSSPQQEPGVLFNGMVAPWCPFAIRGFVWYQGCTNAGEPQRYASKMHALYSGWTEKFENPNLKLYFCQLAPWGNADIARIQMAQAAYEREEPNAAMAVLNDLGNLHDIHPNEKELVGKRLAAHALRRDYGFKIQDNSPTPDTLAPFTNGVLKLTFRDAKALYLYNPDYDTYRNGFEIAGTNGVFHPATIQNVHRYMTGRAERRRLHSTGTIDGDFLLLSSPEVKEPAKIRYLHSAPWFGSLYNEVNLPLGAFEMEVRAGAPARAEVPQAERLAAMNRDKFGVFIHWGLYSILGDGEWVMYQRRIPKAEYNKLADVFRQPKDFSPRAWVRLAKRAGARYCVLTTRHHDGFALWDTKTTDFNSVKTAAGRDYVREFCEACRAEGLRVGLYYSLMNWQIWNQRMPYEKSVWDEQVRVTVEALRELMTNYGRIDYLWYDGCWGPGTSDVTRMLELWPSREMNAMARRLQPGILINDRAKLPEDFATPEQRLDPPATGRAWESCITVNQVWGYRSWDDGWKSSEQLFRSLLHCARFGGNILINIGPRADGGVPEGCVKSLEGLGDIIRQCPDSIYGSERDAWTEATHDAGVVTKANGSYWLWALNSDRLDGAEKMEKVGPRAYRVSFRRGATPCRWLGGRHDIALKPGDAPVLGDDTSVNEPPNGTVELVDEPEATESVFTLPGGGAWKLELGYVTADGFKDTLVETVSAETAGDRRTVKLPAGAKGVYARRMTPAWKCRGPSEWQIAGMFPTEAAEKGFDEGYLRQVLDSAAVLKAARAARFTPVPLKRNARADFGDKCVSMTYSADRVCIGYSLAKTTIASDRDRVVYAAGGADWWWKLFVNGVEQVPFTEGCKPKAFPLKLRKGENEILFAFHCGIGSHTLLFFDNMDR